MAEQGQTPPKGKVDVFDVMKQYKDGGLGIDPTPSFRYMDQLVRAGEVDVQVDDAYIKEKYGQLPEYQQDPSALDRDIKAARLIHTDFQTDRFRPLPRISTRKRGLSPYASFDLTPRSSPYKLFTAKGDEWLDTPQRLAAGRGFFEDTSRESHPLMNDTHQKRNLYAGFEFETDEYGRLREAPVLREQRYNESSFNLDLVSRASGYQPRERWWLGGFAVNMFNSAMELPMYGAAAIENQWGETSKRRLRTMAYMHSQYNSPTFSSTYDDIYLRGDLSMGAQAPVNWSQASTMSEEDAYSLYRALKTNEEEIRARAKEGDIRSKLDANIIDLGDGLYGHGALERLFTTANLLKKTSGLAASERGSQGAFDNPEAFFSGLGTTMGFMLPQMGLSRGAASLAARLGERGVAMGILERAAAKGAKAVLTKAGERAVQTIGGTAPAMQMAGQGYDVAREAGYGHDEARFVAGGYAAAMMAAETLVGSQWMFKSYLGAGGKDSYRKMLLKNLRLAREEAGASRNAIGRAVAASIEWLKGGSNNAWKNRAMNFGEAGLKETFQEAGEEFGDAMVEDMADMITGSMRFKEQRGTNYSLWSRVKEAGLMGGLSGGLMSQLGDQRRHAAPNDPSIWDAVQRGEGANVINAARALYDNKDITQKDLEVVQQDVDLATKSFEAFRDRNQGVYELMKKDGGILPMYGQLSATKRGLMTAIKSMKADPSALPENIAKKEAELKDVEEKLSKIENGHELVDRMKQGAVQAFMSESSRTKTISTESLDKILDWFAGAVDQFKNSAAERKALRETSKKNIANAIDAIADGKSVFEQVNALATAITALATGKALSKEDASRVRNAMKAASEKILANLLATSGGQSQGAQMEAPSLLQDFTQLKDEASLTDAETISALEDDILAGKYGDDASKGYREYARSVLAESQLFGEESNAEAFIQGLPSDQSLDGTPSNSDIMFDMIRSSMERTMTYLKNKESVTQEEMDDIGAMVTSAVALPEAIALAKGPMQKVVESIVTPKAIDDYEGVRKLADDNDRIYKPASEISQEKLDALNEMANSIRSEHTRLGGVVDIRNKQLAHVERTDLLMRAAKCELYVSARPRTKNDAIASAIADVTKMRQALDNISPSAKPSEVEAATNALRKAVLVMEQQVYLELHNNVPFRAAVYNGMLNAFSDDRIQPAASYYWNLTVQKTYSFNQYHRPEILNPSLDPASPDARLISAVSQAAIQDITNWISRLSRVDPAIVYRAFEEYASRYGDQAPLYINQEQYIRAVEIASFLYNPDDKITNQLVLGRIKSNNEHWKDGHIPRSILLPGSQGVGKTTTIRSVIAVLEKMKGRKLKVAIVAPGTSNAVAVQENLVRSNSIEHSMVFGISDIAKIPEAMPDADVVIFDEAHVISTDIAEKVRDVMRKMDRSAGLFLGDHRQVPSMVDLGSMLPIESRMMRTMPLTVSFRHTDVEMIHVLEKLEGQVQKAISQDWKEGQLPSMDETRYTADGRSGVRLFQSIDEVAQSFADETIANPTIDSFLIVLNDAARLSMISKLEKNVELMSAIGQQGLSNRVRMMGQGEHSVLGLEAERVFVAFGPEGLGSSYTRFLYTAMGRSKGSVSAFFPTGRSRQVPELRRSVINTNERAQRTALMKSRIRFDSNSIAPVKSEASAEEESAAPTPAPPPAPDQNDAANSEMQGGVVYLKQDEVPSDKPHLVGMALTIISVTNEGGNISYEVQLPNGEVMRVGADQVQESAPERKVDLDPKNETKEEEPKAPNNENEARDVNPPSSGNRTRLQELYESGRSLAIFTGSMPAVDDSGEPTAFNKSSELFRYRAELLKLLKGYHLPVKFIVRKNVKYNTGADQGRDETPYGNLSIQIHFDINDDTRQQVEAVMQEAMRKAGISLDVKTDTLSSFTMLGSAPAMTKSLNSRFDAYLAQLYQKASALNDGDVLPGYESLQAVQVTQMSVGEPGMAAKNYRVDGGFLPGILYRGKPEQYDVQIPLSELLRKVQEKGGVHSSPRVDGNNYVIDVTSIPGLPPTRVPLQALPIAEDFFDKAAKELSSRNFTDGADLENTMIFGLLQQNQSKFIDHAWPKLPHLRDKMMEHLIIRKSVGRNGKENQYMAFKAKRGDIAGRLASAKALVKIVQDHQHEFAMANERNGKRYGLERQIIKRKTGSESEFVEIMNPEDLQTYVKDVNVPELLIDLTPVLDRESHEAANSGQSSAPEQVPPDPSLFMFSTVASNMNWEIRRELASRAVEYYRRVFGDRFVDGRLDFKPSININGIDAYGVMSNAHITLQVNEEGFVSGIERHEAMHYVMLHLLDEASASDLLRQAKKEIAKANGSDSWMIDDRTAHEWLATQYQLNAPQENSLIDRFFRWLRSALRRWGLYKWRINDLMMAIEDGQFKDQHPITSKQDAPYFAEIADDKPSPLAPSRAKTLGSAASLSAAFGSPAHARSVIASVASALVRFGPYAPMYANEPVGRAVPRLKEVINQVHELYKKQAEKEPVLRNGDQKIEWSSLSQEEIRSLEPSVYRGYVASQLSKDSVYRMVVQSVFPNIDIERFLDDKSMLTLMENESAVDTANTDMDQLDGLSGTARNNNESIRPYDRASGLARMMLENMVLINPIGMSGVESTMMADLDLLLSVGNKAAQGAFYSPDGVDPYDVLGENLKKIYEEDPDGKTGIHAYTLYKRFFDPVGTFTSNAKDLKGKPLQFFSYRYASRSRKNVISRISDDGMRGMAKQRYDYMEKALQHVANLFLDSTTATRMITEVAGSGNARSRYLRFDEGDQERMNLNARVNSMFSASGGILQMSKEFRDRFAVGLPSDVAGANITIGADGVRVGDTVLLKYTDKGPELQSKDVEVIREFFASMNYVVSDQTVKRLTEKDTSLAAELVGGWAASMHATINQLGKPSADKSIWSWRYLEDVNRKKGGFRPVMLSEVSMAGSTDMAEGAEVPLPSSLFSMNQRLARIEGSVRGSGYNRSFKTPGGEMAQADNIGTPLRRMFPSLMNSEHASAVPQKVAEQLLRKLPYLKAPGRILNPLLDANGPVRVKELIAYTGIRKFGGEESADFSRMTSIDFKFGVINAFVDGIVNNPGNQEVVVPLHVFGNRGDGELVSLQFSGKKLFNTSYGKSQSGTSTIKQLDINYEVLDPLIHDRFHSAWNLYKLSTDRWAKFFGLSGGSSSQVVSMISGAKAIDVLASPDLVSGIDYIVKGDSVIPGNALAPDPKNTHYTLENIRAIANANKAGATELRKEISRIFGDEIAYFKRSISGFHPSGETVAEGLFYAHHLADQWVSELVMGPSAAYKGLSDYVKRSTGPMAPGHVGNYTRVPNIAYFIDPLDDPKAFDGQSFTTPWGFVDAVEAYAGLLGDMPGKMREAVNKRIYADASMLVKFSETMVSQRLYTTNPEVARIIDRSLLHLPDLHALWMSMPKENYNQFWQAAKSIIEQARKTGVQDQLIDLVSSHHNGKMGMRSVTPFEDNGPMTPVPLDSRNLILQTNLDRSLDRRNQRAPFFTQLSAIMNVLDHNAMNGKIRADIERKLTELALADFERHLDQQPGETRKEKAIALMAELGIRNAQENNELGQAIDAFTDPDGVSANNPIIRSKMFSALVTALKKDSIAPKLRGQQFTASSGYGFIREESAYEDVEFGLEEERLAEEKALNDYGSFEWLPESDEGGESGFDENALPKESARELAFKKWTLERNDYVNKRVDEARRNFNGKKRLPIDFERLDENPSGDLRGRVLNRFEFIEKPKNGASPFGSVFSDKSLRFLSLDDMRWSASSEETGLKKLKPIKSRVSPSANILRITSQDEYRALLGEKSRFPQPDDIVKMAKESGYDAIQYVPLAKESLTDEFYGARVDKMMSSLGGAQLIVLNNAILEQADGKFVASPVDLSSSNISDGQKAHLPKDQYKSDNSNKFIGRGVGATGEYARLSQEAGKPVNVGKYAASDVVWVSVNGKRSGAQPLDMEELQKAIDAGASFLTDAKARRPEGGNEYNVGEQSLADALRAAGYEETEEVEGKVSRWKKKQVESKRSGLRGPRIEGDKYIPAEIIAPFLYEEEFGFAPGSTMSLSKQQVRDQILARLGGQAVAVFDELTTVYVTRTPASNSSSGHFATIVDFISDAGNTMFLPSELNEKTGGDNDGDQMTMITKHVTVKNGLPEIVRGDDTAQGLMNKLIDNVRDYYDDTRNAQLYMVGVGTKMIEGIAEKTQQERHPYTRKLHTPSSMFAMHEAVFDGDRLIGILANTIKAYSFLAHVHNQTVGTDAYYKVFPGHNLRMFDDNGVPLIISLSEVLNGSLDNVKLMVLGQLGINPDNVGALIGNMLLGKPLDQAVASLRDYDKFVDAVRRNRSITSDDIGSQNMMRYMANELLKLQQKAAMMKVPTESILQQIDELTRLLHPLFVNEAFVRLGTIVSMNTGKNIPTNDSEFLIKSHQMEHILNQPVADLLAEKPVFPQHHYVIEMAQRKPALHQLVEENVRGVIDVNSAVRSMPNVMGYLSVFNKAKEISEKTMLQMSPEIKQLRSVVLEAVGRNGHFGDDGELVWSRAFNDLMVSLNLQSLFGENQVVELPGHGEFAIGTPGGAYRFAMEFPSFFAKQLELLNNMPKDSRPRQLAKSNRFLEAIRVSGGDTPVLEAIDARRYRDPLLKDILVRDFTTLDEIFQIGSDNSMSDLIATYSIIKDRFDYNRNSLFHFLPARTVRSHSRKMDSMLNILQAGTEENQLDDVIVAKTPTESVSYANLLEYLREQAPAAYPELAKVISTNQDPTYFQVARNFARVEGGWKTFVWRPVESSEQDKKKSDIEVIAVSGWNVAPMLRPEPNVYPANTLLNNIGVANYEQLMRGEEVVVSARSWVSPPPESVTQFTLPTGHVAIVKSRSSENLTIVVPGLVQDTNENEDASILPMIMPASQEEMDASLINGQTRYGKNSVDLDQQSITGALELVSRRSPNPFYREMAGLIAPLLQNSGVSTSVRSMSGYGRYRIGSPVVSFGVDNNQLDMDQAVIHEALHVLTARAIEGLDTSSAAKLYKAQMDGLLERYKLNPASKAFAHYTTNTHEFVAGVMSDPSFQHHLNNLSEQGGSFWNRLVNTLRRFISALFPSFKYARNAYVGMVMEATLRYGRDVAFSPGDPRRGQVLYMSTASASGHGMGASHKPIKDIVDIRSRLQTSKKSSRTAEEASIEDQVTNIYRNVMRRNRRVQRIGSVEFSIEGMTEGEAINYIRENVVPMLKQYEDRRKDDVVRTLNEASGSINEVADAWMERFVDRKGRPIDRREDVLRLLGAMGHTNDTKYVRYSSLAKGGSIRHKGTDIAVDQLGVKHVPLFEGHDPIVAITSGQNPTVRLFDITSKSVDYMPRVSGGKTNHLLRNYVGGSMMGSVHGIYYGNDEGGVRSLTLAMQTMALKKANPSLSFERVKVLSMNANGFTSMAVSMPDMVDVIKTIKKTALFGELPTEIRNIVGDESLLDPLIYRQSMIDLYGELLMNRSTNLDKETYEWMENERIKNAYERERSSMLSSPKGLYHMMLNRLNQLSAMNARDGEEYKLLSAALYELGNQDVSGSNTWTDLSVLAKLLTNTNHIENDVVQWVVREVQNNEAAIVEKSRKEWLEHVAMIKDLDSVIRQINPIVSGDKVVEVGWKRFERLFRKSKSEPGGKGIAVYNEAGELVRMNLPMLHWDRNDEETAELLRTGELTEAELTYANKVLDHIYEKMVELQIHELKQTNNSEVRDQETGAFVESAARVLAERHVSSHWNRGWIPIVTKSGGEQITQGRVKQFAKGIGRSASNYDALVDSEYFVDRNEVSVEQGSVPNPYYAEMDSINPFSVGGETRLRRLGLRGEADGSLVLVDPAMSNQFSFNMERIMKHFDLLANRQIIHEGKSMPVMGAAVAYLKAREEQTGMSNARVLDWLDNWARRKIIAKNPDPDPVTAHGLNIAPLANGLVTLGTYGGVALNMKVAAASLIYNQMSSFVTAAAASLSGSDLFGLKEWGQAVSVCVGTKEGNEKMRALMQKLFVNEMQEGDFLNDERGRFNKTGSRVFTSHNLQAMNWVTDYFTRGIVMAAQMMKEGSWDAYSMKDGEVSYNKYLDRRFYNADGSMTKDGKRMMDWLVRKLDEQGVNPLVNGELPVGHDLNMGRSFKWIADKYVIGGMDSSQRVMLDSYWYGKILMQFRKFLPTKFYNWHGKRMKTDEGGRLVVKNDVAVWEKREIESYIAALLRTVRTMRDKRSLDIKTIYKEMDQADRFALARMVADLMVAATMLAIYMGLVSLGDDDDKKEKKKRSPLMRYLLYSDRTVRLFQQGAFDTFQGNLIGFAYQTGQNQNPIPMLSQANHMISALFGDVDQIVRVLPANADVREIMTAVEKWERDNPQELAEN